MPDFWITREFRFTATHHVQFADQQCTGLHGHPFTVRVRVQAPLDHRGMVLDFRADLDPFAKVLADRYDGRYLNDLIAQPTSERIAFALVGELHEAVPATVGMVCEVEVSEAPDVWAGCRHG